MIRRPPRSTLFPYTRSSDLQQRSRGIQEFRRRLRSPDERGPRSEEHTSELQSRGHLVCRLLLEKKKNNDQAIHIDINSLNAPAMLSCCALTIRVTTSQKIRD